MYILLSISHIVFGTMFFYASLKDKERTDVLKQQNDIMDKKLDLLFSMQDPYRYWPHKDAWDELSSKSEKLK